MSLILFFIVCILVFVGIALAVRRTLGLAGFSVKKWKAQIAERAATPTDFHKRMDELGERDAQKQKYGPQRWTLEQNERQYRGVYIPGGENPSVCRLATELEPSALPSQGGPFRSPVQGPVLDTLPKVVFRKEGERDRFGKALGVNREVQSGDERFDSAVYIESDASDEDVSAIVSSPVVREAVLELLELGCNLVGLNHKGHSINVEWKYVKGKIVTEKSSIEHLLDRMDEVARALPPFARATRARSFPRGAGILIANIVVGVIMIPIVILGQMYPPVDNGLAPMGLAISTLVFISVLFLTWLRVRGRATGLRFLLWNAVTMVIGYPLLIVFGLYIINGAFGGLSRDVDTTVIRRWTTTSDNSTSYHIRVDPWPPHESSLKFDVRRADFDRLTRGSDVTLRIVEGALGYEWFDGVVRR